MGKATMAPPQDAGEGCFPLCRTPGMGNIWRIKRPSLMAAHESHRDRILIEDFGRFLQMKILLAQKLTINLWGCHGVAKFSVGGV